jgi:hypothetical protein
MPVKRPVRKKKAAKAKTARKKPIRKKCKPKQAGSGITDFFSKHGRKLATGGAMTAAGLGSALLGAYLYNHSSRPHPAPPKKYRYVRPLAPAYQGNATGITMPEYFDIDSIGY